MKRLRAKLTAFAVGAVLIAIMLLIGWRAMGDPESPRSPSPKFVARGQSLGNAELDNEPADDELASISGTVRSADAAARAIAGARVCAWALDDADQVHDPIAVRCASSGLDGGYELAGLDPRSYRISATAAGKLPCVWADADHGGRQWLTLGYAEDRRDVDLALSDGGTFLGGMVVDVAGGPVEGALVVASGSGMFSRDPVATAISGAQGRFALSVARGEYSLRALASGYAPTSASAQAPNQTLKLQLTPESVLVGRVVDGATGVGVAGVKVTPSRHGSAHLVIVSEADGRFRLAGLGPGVYQPEAIGVGVYGQAATPIHLGLGQTSAPIELRVFPAYRLRGQIVAIDTRLPERERERPCVGGRLFLHGAGFRRQAYADRQGWVVLEGVPAGRHDLRLYCPDQLEGIEQRLVLDGDLDEQRWAIEVGGWEIAGRVVDSRSRGVEGAHIDSTGPGGGSHNISRADGSFTLTVHESGTHVLTAKLRRTKDVMAKIEVEVADAKVEGVELEVGELGALRGRVEDPEGRPVAGAKLALCDARGRPRIWVVSDGEGRFGFDAQPLGHAWVALASEVGDEPAGKAIGRPVEFVRDRTTEITVVTETKRGSIRGTVSAEGGPADDAWVVAGRASIESLVADWEVGPVLCDLDGRFTLDGLGEGTWAVRAFREDGGEASRGALELGADIQLELVASASVAGRVQFADGSVPDHFEILARSGKHRRKHQFYRSEGAYELAELAPGTWTLQVTTNSGSGALALDLSAGEQAENDIELEPRVTIRGRAVDSKTGAPVSSVAIAVNQPNGYRQQARFEDDGSFELEGVAPGRVELVVTPRDWRNGAYKMQLPIIQVAAEPAVQDIGELPLVRAAPSSK